MSQLLEAPYAQVLDKGYVRYIDHMGTDLSVVNAARASFASESGELSPKDDKLIAFLLREEHTSPFRHAFFTFEVKAPLMVSRQWWKHVVGSDHLDFLNAWNEQSKRYVTANTELYLPDVWRQAPDNKKQGSGEDFDKGSSEKFRMRLAKLYYEAENLYDQALAEGVCAEQARLFLPAYGLYVTWRWSCSLQAVLHFCRLREANDAQREIQDYAKAIRLIAEPLFPVTFKTFFEVNYAPK